MAFEQSANECRQRAAQMRDLAQKAYEPGFRRSCEELAEGWEALARQQDLAESQCGTVSSPRTERIRRGQA